MKSIITALWLEVEIFFLEVTVSLHFQCTDRKGKKKKKVTGFTQKAFQSSLKILGKFISSLSILNVHMCQTASEKILASSYDNHALNL